VAWLWTNVEVIAMQMTGSNGIFSVPSEHFPGLVVLVLVMPVLWVGLSAFRALARQGWPRTVRILDRYDGLAFTAKAVLFASVVGALVHAAIVPTHWGDERVTAMLFIVDVVGFALSFWWTFTGRPQWRLVSVAMLGGTAATYALYIVLGWETMDLVGLVTTTIELAAALVVLSPALSPRREYRLALAAVPVALVTLLGTGEIASATSTAPAPATSSASPAGRSMASMPGMPSMSSKAPTQTTPLSLATSSPAGPITWPDAMGTMAAGMKMATPHCTAQPTAAQQHAAVSLVDATVSAAAPYKSLAAAKAAGYIPLTRSGQRIVHYINPAIYRQNHLVDPTSIPVLVYANTSHGAVLLAAMYLMPRADDAAPPQPGGCLTQWHIHTDLCFSSGRVVGTDASAPCTGGSTNAVTQPMMHVWMTPVTGGPLAPDPTARSEVLSALQIPVLSPPNGTA
jgi:hypothetical protein